MPPRFFQSRRRRCASLAIPMHRGSTFATGPSLAFLWNRWSSSHKENILLMSAASDSRETEIGERLTPSLTTTKIECDYGGADASLLSTNRKNRTTAAPSQSAKACVLRSAVGSFFLCPHSCSSYSRHSSGSPPPA